MYNVPFRPTSASIENVPEKSYGSAVQEQRRVQSEVVARHALRINAVVRAQAQGRDKTEATQVATLALLEALGDFDPTRGVELWTFAYKRVRSAVADWAASELGAKRAARGENDPREQRNRARRHPEAFDETAHAVDENNPESLMIEAEERLRLEVFASGLSDEDRRALVPTVGRPRKGAAGRNNTLRTRALAFLEGK